MTAPLSTWLRLREPADAAARSAQLTGLIADTLAGHPSVHALDLATGTGSNIRFLMDRLPPTQRWTAVDRDDRLLAEVPVRVAAHGRSLGHQAEERAHGCRIVGDRLDCDVVTRQMDLGELDDASIFEGRQLVTASALLDLVSEGWLQKLAAHSKAAQAVLLLSLTYNGMSVASPTVEDDELIRELLNRHQRRNKGLGGRAAGPEAADVADRVLKDAGYVVRRATSNWTIEPAAQPFQRELMQGWVEAALEVSPHMAPRIARWHERRLAHLDGGRSWIVVGHDDLAAWLPPA
jgi:hypothetical protein